MYTPHLSTGHYTEHPDMLDHQRHKTSISPYVLLEKQTNDPATAAEAKLRTEMDLRLHGFKAK